MSNLADWMEINDQYLAAKVGWIRLRLENLAQAQTKPAAKKKTGWFQWLQDHTSEAEASQKTPMHAHDAIEQVLQEMVKLEANDPPPALILLAKALSLTKFDCELLALCAAMALDTRIAGLCAQAQTDSNQPYPTFALAFALFDDPDWNALSPHGPLRYWRLLEINQPGAQPVTAAALAADERIVNYLKGLNYLDDRLTPLFDPVNVRPVDEALPPSQQQAVDFISNYLNDPGGEPVSLIEVLGHDIASKRLIAEQVAATLGLKLQTMAIKTLPAQSGDFETFTRLWQRESLLMPLALYIDYSGAGETENALLKRFIERGGGIVFVDIQDTRIETLRRKISIEVNKPTPEEQAGIWSEALQNQGSGLTQRLSGQYSFDRSEIITLAETVLRECRGDESALDDSLWRACRLRARVGMEQLAQRIDTKAVWDELVLPAEQKALLRQITDQVAQRNRVYDAWGFREKMNRGLGISALFAGESGTGKTMAAEVIANELKLDLFRIDLSAVVSKYIGETEKNLRKLFDAAEDSGAILFFDEADALFGKRSEVKDSHDRYANIEINYLLQRMEAYRGLAILATNMKNALDKAFVRRLRFIVDFPFPGTEERTAIWKKVFPAHTPIAPSLDYPRLAALNLTGGNIHNVALNAAFLAAQLRDGQITMPLLLNAARSEFKKLERPAKESDFRWLDQAEGT
ncbi:MAG: AAA family ATPase [Methylomonas sp.]|nr:MAG: AAA family ATPase [Methylomonas sp.]